MEEQQVLPIWVLCIAVSSTMAWPIALCIWLKQGHHPSAQLLAHLSEVHLFPTLGGAVHLEVISIEEVKPFQRLDDEIIDCKGGGGGGGHDAGRVRYYLATGVCMACKHKLTAKPNGSSPIAISCNVTHIWIIPKHAVRAS